MRQTHARQCTLGHMPATLIGAHLSTSKGLGAAVREGRRLGCTAVQLFTSSPQQWKSRDVTPEMTASLHEACEETGIYSLVSHDSYLINLCAPDEDIRRKSLDALTRELNRCAQLGIRYVVSHIGAHMTQGENCGLDAAAEQIEIALSESAEQSTLLMETTAGQGTCLNYRFEQLAAILDRLKGNPRVCVCLDTCHIFAAGYDIRTPERYETTFEEFDRLIGLDRLKVIHANDSKKPLGKRVDRHEHIGEGEIGIDAFRLLVNDPRFEHTPIILETPAMDSMLETNLKTLFELRAEPVLSC